MRLATAEQVRQRFESKYETIHQERFLGLPIANPAVSVRVVGLQETEDLFTFCLLTPWMLNQVAVAKCADVRSPGVRAMRRDRVEGLGEFFVRNRISPMDEFDGMDAAVKKAEELAREIHELAAQRPDDTPQDDARRRLLTRIAGRRREI